MRGKEFWGCCCAGCHRITPACAGKSCNLSGVLCQFRDHPRVCGEKHPQFGTLCFTMGSPPRVRGKGWRTVAEALMIGITPACAGKSRLQGSNLQLPGDHPRVCGGITPACAGKRASRAARAGSIGDHPRVCGEKSRSTASRGWKQGSPPRVRGKGTYSATEHGYIRITPACAGKSNNFTTLKMYKKDHPRVCGEKSVSDFLQQLCQGSPPRVRGKGKEQTQMMAG